MMPPPKGLVAYNAKIDGGRNLLQNLSTRRMTVLIKQGKL